MFDRAVPDGGASAASSGCPSPASPDERMLRAWRDAVEQLAHEVAADRGEAADPGGAAAQALRLIGELESLAAAAAAAQAALAVQADRCRRAQEAANEVPARRRGRGVAAEIGLARRVSGTLGSRLLGLGKALVNEMPHTFGALAGGHLSEWRATLLVRETACLPIEERAAVDAELCADPDTLAGKGDRAIAAAAKQAAYRRDPTAVVRRAEQAEKDRRVWLRPAPDQMAYLTALLPLTQGVAAYAALHKAAESARATGEAGERGRGQLMADALVSRLTGLEDPEQVPIRVDLLMTDAALFQGDGEPGILPGYGPVPAAWARRQVGRAGAASWVRRLYLAPDGGALVAMDSTSRTAPDGLADFIRLRDQGTCRISWCSAPIQHIDHVLGVAAGGPTSEANSSGDCESHNYAKEAPGWSVRSRTRTEPHSKVAALQPHLIDIRTPAGLRYTSRAPDPPRSPQRRRAKERQEGPAP